MIWTAPALTIQIVEIQQVKTLDYGIDNTHRVVLRYILIGVDRQEQPVVIVRFCM